MTLIFFLFLCAGRYFNVLFHYIYNKLYFQCITDYLKNKYCFLKHGKFLDNLLNIYFLQQSRIWFPQKCSVFCSVCYFLLLLYTKKFTVFFLFFFRYVDVYNYFQCAITSTKEEYFFVVFRIFWRKSRSSKLSDRLDTIEKFY